VQQVFQLPFPANGDTARESTEPCLAGPRRKGDTVPSPGNLPLHETQGTRRQINYLRRMAALISDPDVAFSLLEIATQFEEQLAPLDVGCVTADARRAMARRVPGGEHHTTERSLLSPRQERPVFLTGEAVSEVAAEASNRTAVSGKTRSCPSAILVTRYCGTPLSDSGRSRTIRNGPGIAAPLTDRVCPT
jgi:hypothetical protein